MIVKRIMLKYLWICFSRMLKNSFYCHTREGGYPEKPMKTWIPAFAGMTNPGNLRLFQHAVSLFILLALSACQREPVPRTYFPETGKYALHQRTIDLANDFKVLSLALEPGFEDLETLAYLRLAKGATVMSAYFTNGEAGESDVHGEYPHDLADRKSVV